jgi:diguanylate cyclase (GGDEF)-like protein/PAS domain S-box-containing protein
MSTLGIKTAKQAVADLADKCVLFIDTGAHDGANLRVELISAQEEQFHIECVTELSKGIDRLRIGGISAVILNITSSASNGMASFDNVFRVAPFVPILILSDAETEEAARYAVRRGAKEYLVKNQTDACRLSRAVRTMLRPAASDAMLVESEIAKATLDAIGEGVIRTDSAGNITYLNRMAEKLTGWSRDEAVGQTIGNVLLITDGVGGTSKYDPIEIMMQEDNTGHAIARSMNSILVRRDGFELGVENMMTLLRGPDGSVTGSVFAFRDVSAARASSIEMSHKAQHDFLTDLPNRMLFNDRLNQAISLAERQSKQLAVMFVDIDHFKKINDSLGHGVGDRLLKSVAARLVSCVRRTDTVSRLGGDEFVVLLSQVEHEQDAAFSARKILRALGSPHPVDNKSLDITVSIGVSTYPTDARDGESLMNNADTAMYEAKQDGRNSYQFFRSEMRSHVAERLALEGDLRYALGRKEFVLHYQPKLNLRNGQITGMEALIRWVHPRRGLVPPLQFVPIAEECGLIVPIGRWVLLEACRQAREWIDSGIGIVPIAVNVSAAEFAAKDFVSVVRSALIATGVEGSNLELELTESVLMQDAESTVGVLSALRAMGVQLAIDDFGTGYSSFSYLRRFPVDVLKIHQSFVHEIAEQPDNASIVAAMINIGKSLKQKVIAEGVETLAQVKFLQEHGCDEGQGYYFSRPVTVDQIKSLLRQPVQQEAFG